MNLKTSLQLRQTQRCARKSGFEQLSFESSEMKRIVPRFSGFDHGIEDGQELAHASDDGDLFGFSGSDEAVVELFDDGIETDGCQGGHIEAPSHLPTTTEDGALAAHLSGIAVEGRHADQGADFAAGEGDGPFGVRQS